MGVCNKQEASVEEKKMEKKRKMNAKKGTLLSIKKINATKT